uniref:Uncharacterized protein n=1 Tax=Toxoplasma gondii TgCATBr9 TaxID=943120 RepID=A0A2T6ISE6_TOXGO|nr:hypothetical protein TGBR9_382480 [Toxoplasma gondii TgCATBr9]
MSSTVSNFSLRVIVFASWDPKKRKYIMMKVDSATGRAVKRKRGTDKQEEKTSSAHRYAQWCRETKRRIQRVGEEESPELAAAPKDKRGKGRGADKHFVSSSGGLPCFQAPLVALFMPRVCGVSRCVTRPLALCITVVDSSPFSPNVLLFPLRSIAPVPYRVAICFFSKHSRCSGF